MTVKQRKKAAKKKSASNKAQPKFKQTPALKGRSARPPPQQQQYAHAAPPPPPPSLREQLLGGIPKPSLTESDFNNVETNVRQQYGPILRNAEHLDDQHLQPILARHATNALSQVWNSRLSRYAAHASLVNQLVDGTGNRDTVGDAVHPLANDIAASTIRDEKFRREQEVNQRIAANRANDASMTTASSVPPSRRSSMVSIVSGGSNSSSNQNNYYPQYMPVDTAPNEAQGYAQPNADQPRQQQLRINVPLTISVGQPQAQQQQQTVSVTAAAPAQPPPPPSTTNSQGGSQMDTSSQLDTTSHSGSYDRYRY